MGQHTFHFEGHAVTAREGQSLAAALTDNGVRAFRETAKGQTRGIFCGMGICQDCLVEIDGQPNQRACMVKVKDGMQVARQVASPKFSKPVATNQADPLFLSPDVLVVGGGAGGLSAAIAASQAGAETVLLDERKVAGGQYYKQAADHSILDQQQAEGARLFDQAIASGSVILSGVEIWGAFDGLRFFGQQDGRPAIATPKTAIIATGAYERPVTVPGWTLPGVMTTGAAQTLWRSYKTLPGRRVAVCGSGPLNVQVALELAKGGSDIAFIAERAPAALSKPITAIAMALADPKLSIQGLRMLAELHQRGVKVHTRSELARVDAHDGALLATFRSSNGTQTRVSVDALCMNGGFEPQNEILRLLGAKMVYDPAMGHLRCQKSDTMQSSVKGLYAIGDCTGLGGAPAARLEGEIAGASAAADAIGVGSVDLSARHQTLAKHRAFQKRLWTLYEISPAKTETLPDETVMCRCEELTLGDLRGGMATEPGHVGTLKRATRVGMGRCQGRYCGPVAARMVADQTGKPVEDLSFFAPRVPIKPVAISAIMAAEEAAAAQAPNTQSTDATE